MQALVGTFGALKTGPYFSCCEDIHECELHMVLHANSISTLCFTPVGLRNQSEGWVSPRGKGGKCHGLHSERETIGSERGRLNCYHRIVLIR